MILYGTNVYIISNVLKVIVYLNPVMSKKIEALEKEKYIAKYARESEECWI